MDHDHLPALSALLLSAPLVVLALAGVQFAAGHCSTVAQVALERARATPSAGKLVALLLMTAGVIHVGLVPGHLDEPILAAAFAIAGGGLIALAAAAILRFPHWRSLGAAALAAILGAYTANCLAGVEAIDALGVATAAIEVVALGLVVSRRPLAPGPLAMSE